MLIIEHDASPYLSSKSHIFLPYDENMPVHFVICNGILLNSQALFDRGFNDLISHTHDRVNEKHNMLTHENAEYS